MTEIEETGPGVKDSLNLAKLAGIHWGAALLVLSLFAATDSWSELTGWGLANGLNIIMGILAGFIATSVLHEWGHFAGARLSGGRYSIPEKAGIFVYDWDFEANSVRQFLQMSAGGSIGGIVGVLWLGSNIVPDNAGRAALIAGALGSFVFAAVIEWPILARVRRGGDPMTELSGVNVQVLRKAFLSGASAGFVSWLVIS